jgi:hypothetical protein
LQQLVSSVGSRKITVEDARGKDLLLLELKLGNEDIVLKGHTDFLLRHSSIAGLRNNLGLLFKLKYPRGDGTLQDENLSQSLAALLGADATDEIHFPVVWLSNLRESIVFWLEQAAPGTPVCLFLFCTRPR